MQPDESPRPDQPEQPQTAGIFPHTRWSMVCRAKDLQHTENPAALEELCRLYWKPVYLFVRSRRYGQAEAEDLTQEFFARLLAGRYLGSVDGPEKGKLRSFLAVVLKRFLADEYNKANAKKRGGSWKAVPIDSAAAETQFAELYSNQESPSLLFDRQWAIELLAQAVENLRLDYANAGQSEIFETLKSTISPHVAQTSYSDFASALGMTPGATKVAVHRFRRRYRDRLKSTLRDTLENPEDADEELLYLISLFSAP